MPTFMSSVERAHRSAGSAAEKRALPNRLRKSERGMLRMGSKKSEQWKRSPTEGLYQVVVSEVREDGRTHPLERGGGRAFAVTSVLDLGLRMLESPRGRSGMWLLIPHTHCGRLTVFWYSSGGSSTKGDMRLAGEA